MSQEVEIRNVYFFGSLQGTFEIFPNSNIPHHFGKQHNQDWVMAIHKQGGMVTHMFSISNRTGFSFGIVFQLIGKIFDDFQFLREEVFEFFLEEMIKDGELIRKDNQGNIQFIPSQLKDVRNYLNAWIRQITTAGPQHFGDHLQPIPSIIPDYTNKPIPQLHPDNDPSILTKEFHQNGAIELSNRFPKIRHNHKAQQELKQVINKLTADKQELKQTILSLQSKLGREQEKMQLQQQQFEEGKRPVKTWIWAFMSILVLLAIVLTIRLTAIKHVPATANNHHTPGDSSQENVIIPASMKEDTNIVNASDHKTTKPMTKPTATPIPPRELSNFDILNNSLEENLNYLGDSELTDLDHKALMREILEDFEFDAEVQEKGQSDLFFEPKSINNFLLEQKHNHFRIRILEKLPEEGKISKLLLQLESR